MNPLLQKYEELYGKKEEPKPPEPPKPVEKSKLRKLAKCYDRDDLKVSFQQVADKIQQGKARVVSMSMGDVMSIMPNKIIFEVYVDDL